MRVLRPLQGLVTLLLGKRVTPTERDLEEERIEAALHDYHKAVEAHKDVVAAIIEADRRNRQYYRRGGRP